MNARHTVAFVLSCSLPGAVLNVDSRAESPEAAGNLAIVQNDAASGPVNLKVLPKDISQADVLQLMVGYGQELGVQCGFCHAENPQTQQVDFESDENPRKQTARIMIGMLRDINTKYLPQVGDRRYAAPISCGNCHQGQTYPPPYEPRSRP